MRFARCYVGGVFTIIYIAAARCYRLFLFDATPHGIAAAHTPSYGYRIPADARQDLVDALEAAGRTYADTGSEKEFRRRAREAREQRNSADLMPRCRSRAWAAPL